VAQGYFVVLHGSHGPVAVRVAALLGVVAVSSAQVQALPPLLAGGASPLVAGLTRRDAELLLVLDGVRLLSDALDRELGGQS
jgi:chemotaxis signal transduction protein